MSHRYRLDPTPGQAEGMVRHCAHARYVWNLALEQTNQYRAHRGPTPSNAQRMRQLAEARQGSWLGEGSSSVQQAALRDFDQALRNWWNGTHRRPTWRRRGVNEGFVIRDLTVRKLNQKWATITVPKVGQVRFRLSRPLPARSRSARVTLDRAGRWHVSLVAIPDQIPGPCDGSVVGIDRGVVIDYQASDGRAWDVPEPDWAQRARLQRRLARQRKGSNRRARTKARLARLCAREADRRKDAIEKATTELARTVDVIALEDLRVAWMMRSARGTVDAPGKRVAQKAGLNRSIASTGWAMFARRLGDKIGDRKVLVPAAGTSQTCSSCGHRDKKSRESQARFVCRSCGVVCNADLNAAMNIAAAGRAVVGRGRMVQSGPPVEASTSLGTSTLLSLQTPTPEGISVVHGREDVNSIPRGDAKPVANGSKEPRRGA